MTQRQRRGRFFALKASAAATAACVAAAGAGGRTAAAQEQEQRQDGQTTTTRPPACMNYYEHPGAPDWGCSEDKPLCVTAATGKRPEEKGAPGDLCASYPCRNSNKCHDKQVDEGCPPSHPVCVDALDQDPPAGRPGMKCVERRSGGTVDVGVDADAKSVSPETAKQQKNRDENTVAGTAAGLWGLRNAKYLDKRGVDPYTNRNLDDAVRQKGGGCFISGDGTPPRNDKGELSLCNGCPFGISKRCTVPHQHKKYAW